MLSPEFLTRLEGTTVTINPSPDSPLHVGPTRWEIVSKRDATNGLGPAYAAGKFLCRPASPDNDNPNSLSFMRIYKQIPIAGTEFTKAPMRAAQAANADEPTELTAFKFLEQKGGDVIPRLLGYHHDQQDRDDTVPGGVITYVIWAKVAGDSLDWEAFWSSSFSQRQEIRLQFDEVYEKVKACAYNSGTGMRKIIYDWPTKTMHLSGLSDWTPAAEGTKWPDSIYVNYGLVQPPTAKDHFFSIHSEDLQCDDKGWNW